MTTDRADARQMNTLEDIIYISVSTIRGYRLYPLECATRTSKTFSGFYSFSGQRCRLLVAAVTEVC